MLRLSNELSKEQMNRRLLQLIDGLILGFGINFLVSITFEGFSDFWFAVIGVTGVCGILLTVWWFKSERQLKWKHKLRLIFVGVSASSFIFALVDVLRTMNSKGTITWIPGTSRLVIEGVPFVSILTSAVFGGLFALAEHVLYLIEKHDL